MSYTTSRSDNSLIKKNVVQFARAFDLAAGTNSNVDKSDGTLTLKAEIGGFQSRG